MWPPEWIFVDCIADAGPMQLLDSSLKFKVHRTSFLMLLPGKHLDVKTYV